MVLYGEGLLYSRDLIQASVISLGDIASPLLLGSMRGDAVGVASMFMDDLIPGLVVGKGRGRAVLILHEPPRGLAGFVVGVY